MNRAERRAMEKRGGVMSNQERTITTTYAILRHNGVEIGKGDFLGRS